MADGNGNGNGKTLLALILAGATLVLNGGLWIVNRMTQMDEDRQKLAIVVEQRMGRIEARLDELVYRLGGRGSAGPSSWGAKSGR